MSFYNAKPNFPGHKFFFDRKYLDNERKILKSALSADLRKVHSWYKKIIWNFSQNYASLYLGYSQDYNDFRRWLFLLYLTTESFSSLYKQSCWSFLKESPMQSFFICSIVYIFSKIKQLKGWLPRHNNGSPWISRPYHAKVETLASEGYKMMVWVFTAVLHFTT